MSVLERIAHFLGLATLKDLEGLRTRSLRASKPNPVQISQSYPVYFTLADGAGTAYVPSHLFQPFALRHGIVLRFIPLGGQVPGLYGFITPNPEIVEIEVASALIGPGQLVPAQGTVSVIAVTLAQDVNDFEAITGVPDGGFIEGTEIGSNPIMVGGEGVYGATELDLWTSTGFVVRMESGAPVVFQ